MKYINEAGVQRLLQKIDSRITQRINQSGGGGGPVGDIPGTLKIATFNAPCSNLLSVVQNSEGGWNIDIGFNVTDNQDGTVTLTDFDFSYDLDATFFRDYWMLMILEDSVDRYSVLSFLEALEGMGYVKPNYLFGMGISSVRGSSSGYEYFGIIVLECPDESAKNDLLDLLSISYLQIGYTIPEITVYDYGQQGLQKKPGMTTPLLLSNAPEAKQTIIDKIMEHKNTIN
jgi:hypothetical protein